VYDVTNKKSFENVMNKWYPIVEEQVDSDTIIFLLGNKSDLQNHAVPKEEGAQFAKTKNMEFEETSAKSGKMVEEVFIRLLESAFKFFKG
jgi:GTPase SAR1 family protein